MLVRSLKYPQVVVTKPEGVFRFVNGLCDMPEHLALNITQMSPDYRLETEQTSQPGEAKLRFNPAMWGKDYKKLIFDGPVGYNNGYGKASMMLMEALDKYSDLYVVNSTWIGSNHQHKSDNLQRILDKRTDHLDGYYMKFFPAFEFGLRLHDRHIGYTMLESTRIPKTWVDLCNNNCERIIVPCEQQRQAFIDSGVKVDVISIPLGLIPEMFPVQNRRERETFTFGTMGTLTYRKGTDVLVKAFFKAFPKDKYPDVRLIIKTLQGGGVTNLWFVPSNIVNDQRIVVSSVSLSPKDLVEVFFKGIDCFVFPTRGEGFGYPPLEAMATGLPTICTNFSGCEEFINNKVAYPLNYKLVDVPNGKFGGYPQDLQAEGQQWADPDEDHLVELMRKVYENREQAKKKGLKAAEYVRKNFDINITAQKVIKYLDDKF